MQANRIRNHGCSADDYGAILAQAKHSANLGGNCYKVLSVERANGRWWAQTDKGRVTFDDLRRGGDIVLTGSHEYI